MFELFELYWMQMEYFCEFTGNDNAAFWLYLPRQIVMNIELGWIDRESIIQTFFSPNSKFETLFKLLTKGEILKMKRNTFRWTNNIKELNQNNWRSEKIFLEALFLHNVRFVIVNSTTFFLPISAEKRFKSHFKK